MGPEIGVGHLLLCWNEDAPVTDDVAVRCFGLLGGLDEVDLRDAGIFAKDEDGGYHNFDFVVLQDFGEGIDIGVVYCQNSMIRVGSFGDLMDTWSVASGNVRG